MNELLAGRLIDEWANQSPPRAKERALVLHPRVMLAREAENAIRAAFFDAAFKHDLTTVELLQVVNAIEAAILKRALRAERHPDDPSSPADVTSPV